MKAKTDIFFDAITLLPEDIVEEAQEHRFRKRPAVWKKLGSLAACLVLIASVSLLMLPRGCGGSGAAPDLNGSAPPLLSTDNCAPSEAPADSGDTAPAVPEPDAPAGTPEEGYGPAEERQLLAVVLEIHEDSLLVESEGEQLTVSTAGLTLPELTEGDTVQITYTGPISTAPPAGIQGTVSIEKIENDG